MKFFRSLLIIPKRIDHWWFGHQSPAALGLLRIFMGFYAFLSLSLTGLLFGDWYTEASYTPTKLINDYLSWPSSHVWDNTPLAFRLPFDIPRLGLLNHVTSTPVMAAAYILTMVLAVMFMLGWRTRITGALLFVMLTSVHTRNPLIIHSGDTLMRLCIFYLALGPSGLAYSLDRRRQVKANPELAHEPLPRVSIWAQRLIAYQIALVYLATVWWKLLGTFWLDGTATWYPSQMHEFYRFPLPSILERQPFVGVTTYGTLAAEIALGTFVFYRPTRKVSIILGILMHAYIEYHFNIPMFAAIIVSGYIAFYEGDEVERWVSRVREKWSRRQTAPLPAQTEA